MSMCLNWLPTTIYNQQLQTSNTNNNNIIVKKSEQVKRDEEKKRVYEHMKYNVIITHTDTKRGVT